MTKVYYISKKPCVWYAVFICCFIFGICFGAFCCAYANSDTDKTLYEYLNGFFSNFSQNSDYISILKRSISNNSKIFLIILSAGFFSIGAVISAVCVVLKGFVCGFTAAAFVKYYGFRGLWLCFAGLPSGLIFFPAMIIFAVISAKFSKEKFKKENVLLYYIVFSLIVYAVFCISAVIEGYVTAIFMKLIMQKI
ncbi:MAG: stage II sporulation protein M [Clostridia bacterium]|nr:stage II sporulation protein M [Clostridia bacterium]